MYKVLKNSKSVMILEKMSTGYNRTKYHISWNAGNPEVLYYYGERGIDKDSFRKIYSKATLDSVLTFANNWKRRWG